MTADEKKRSVYLWTKFMDAQLRDDFISSWKFWVERLEFLQDIGVDTTIDSFKGNYNNHKIQMQPTLLRKAS
jgi:hypothetical protein